MADFMERYKAKAKAGLYNDASNSIIQGFATFAEAKARQDAMELQKEVVGMRRMALEQEKAEREMRLLKEAEDREVNAIKNTMAGAAAGMDPVSAHSAFKPTTVGPESFKGVYESGQRKRDMSGERFDEQKRQKASDIKLNAFDKFQSQNKKSFERLGSAKSAKELLERAKSGNPIAGEPAKSSIARLAGEVGVLTDQDLARLGGSRAVMDKLEQAAERAFSGKLTDENIGFLSDITESMERAVKKNLHDEAKRFSAGRSRASGIPQQEFEDVLGVQDFKVMSEDDEALEWAKANPNDPRAAKILEAQGVK